MHDECGIEMADDDDSLHYLSRQCPNTLQVLSGSMETVMRKEEAQFTNHTDG